MNKSETVSRNESSQELADRLKAELRETLENYKEAVLSGCSDEELEVHSEDINRIGSALRDALNELALTEVIKVTPPENPGGAND